MRARTRRRGPAACAAADLARQRPSARITWNRSESDVPSMADQRRHDCLAAAARPAGRALRPGSARRGRPARGAAATSAREPGSRASARSAARRTRGSAISASASTRASKRGDRRVRPGPERCHDAPPRIGARVAGRSVELRQRLRRQPTQGRAPRRPVRPARPRRRRSSSSGAVAVEPERAPGRSTRPCGRGQVRVRQVIETAPRGLARRTRRRPERAARTSADRVPQEPGELRPASPPGNRRKTPLDPVRRRVGRQAGQQHAAAARRCPPAATSVAAARSRLSLSSCLAVAGRRALQQLAQILARFPPSSRTTSRSTRRSSGAGSGCRSITTATASSSGSRSARSRTERQQRDERLQRLRRRDLGGAPARRARRGSSRARAPSAGRPPPARRCPPARRSPRAAATDRRPAAEQRRHRLAGCAACPRPRSPPGRRWDPGGPAAAGSAGAAGGVADPGKALEREHHQLGIVAAEHAVRCGTAYGPCRSSALSPAFRRTAFAPSATRRPSTAARRSARRAGWRARARLAAASSRAARMAASAPGSRAAASSAARRAARE